MLLLTGRLKQLYALRIPKLTANQLTNCGSFFSSEFKLPDSCRIELALYFIGPFFRFLEHWKVVLRDFFAIYLVLPVRGRRQSIT